MSMRTPCGVRTRRASLRASTMPSCATHHNDEAINTISNCPPENGKAVALAHRNCTCAWLSIRAVQSADLMSSSVVSIPITDRGCDAYRDVNRPSPAPISRIRVFRKSAARRIAWGITRAGSTSVAMIANSRACFCQREGGSEVLIVRRDSRLGRMPRTLRAAGGPLYEPPNIRIQCLWLGSTIFGLRSKRAIRLASC